MHIYTQCVEQQMWYNKVSICYLNMNFFFNSIESIIKKYHEAPQNWISLNYK
jgi:hypothetical protein